MTPKTTHNDSCTMAFGRPSKHSECPRCEELKTGAEPRKGWGWQKKRDEARQLLEIRNHDCERSGCSIVCTFGDW